MAKQPTIAIVCKNRFPDVEEINLGKRFESFGVTYINRLEANKELLEHFDVVIKGHKNIELEVETQTIEEAIEKWISEMEAETGVSPHILRSFRQAQGDNSGHSEQNEQPATEEHLFDSEMLTKELDVWASEESWLPNNRTLWNGGSQGGGSVPLNDQATVHIPVESNKQYFVYIEGPNANEMYSGLFGYNASGTRVVSEHNEVGVIQGMLPNGNYVSTLKLEDLSDVSTVRLAVREGAAKQNKVWFGYEDELPVEISERLRYIRTYNVKLKTGQLAIAHRGGEIKYAEESIISFEKAVDMGFKAIEYDLRQLKSGESVLLHDDTILRTARLFDANGNVILTRIDQIPEGTKVFDIDGFEIDLTLAKQQAVTPVNELTLFDLEKYNFAGGSETINNNSGKVRIATLRQVLERFSHITNVIEVRSNEDVHNLLTVLNDYRIDKSNIIVSSWVFPLLNLLRSLDKDIKVLNIRSDFNNYDGDSLLGLGNSGVSISKSIVKEYYDEHHKEGLHVDVWTINTNSELRQLLTDSGGRFDTYTASRGAPATLTYLN